MKNSKVIILLLVLILIMTTAGLASAKGGYDQWGYNYRANIFNGMYCDSYRDAAWCQPYKDVHLQMKWNDAWLDENKVRHDGYSSYIGSGAWLTNHQSGEYEMDGKTCKWNYFVKIKAVPEGATLDGGVWYAADGSRIGTTIWGQFATVQSVTNDGCEGLHGVDFSPKPGSPGLGN